MVCPLIFGTDVEVLWCKAIEQAAVPPVEHASRLWGSLGRYPPPRGRFWSERPPSPTSIHPGRWQGYRCLTSFSNQLERVSPWMLQSQWSPSVEETHGYTR